MWEGDVLILNPAYKALIGLAVFHQENSRQQPKTCLNYRKSYVGGDSDSEVFTQASIVWQGDVWQESISGKINMDKIALKT